MDLKAKLLILVTGILILAGMGWSLYDQHKKIEKLNSELLVASNNNKAYEAENSALNDKVIEFQLTAEQLTHSKDSLLEKLNSARKSLNIKDKQLRDLQYLASTTHKVDTVVMRDTIFKVGVALDTSLVDD